MPVTRFVAPGPSVARHAPGTPVLLDIASAMNAAPVSCRARTNSRPASRKPSMRSTTSPPGWPKTWRTPAAWSRSPMTRPTVDTMRNYHRMEGPPPQYTIKNIDEYLEHLSKGVFQAGISWRVVDAKWPTIRTAFHKFKVERVAGMTDREIDALAKDERVIRSSPKIAAIVHNAREILTLERDEGFKKHLRSFDEYEDLAKDLKKRFKFVGDSGVYHFLWTVKVPVPDWRDCRRPTAWTGDRAQKRPNPVSVGRRPRGPECCGGNYRCGILDLDPRRRRSARAGTRAPGAPYCCARPRRTPRPGGGARSGGGCGRCPCGRAHGCWGTARIATPGSPRGRWASRSARRSPRSRSAH